MKRDLFGGPRPANAMEMLEAMTDRDLDPGEVHAAIYEAQDADPDGWSGWYAEIADAASGRGMFVTLNFPTSAALIKALRDAGIASFEEV